MADGKCVSVEKEKKILSDAICALSCAIIEVQFINELIIRCLVIIKYQNKGLLTEPSALAVYILHRHQLPVNAKLLDNKINMVRKMLIF